MLLSSGNVNQDMQKLEHSTRLKNFVEEAWMFSIPCPFNSLNIDKS